MSIRILRLIAGAGRAVAAGRCVCCVLAVSLLLATAILTTSVIAGDRRSYRMIAARVADMHTAQSAVETLADMTNGRRPFDRRAARAAGQDLVSTMAAVPKRFRPAVTVQASRARHRIWSHWPDFLARARAAERAARQLRTDDRARLRGTLPSVVVTCIHCHQIYREP
ncbi:c-type cytochrome [Pukyongiella litopenaei]|nr:cytochrome c [Pukyongiella litopenaei]